jgi:uncharacterized membrane protein YbaN (DUF454 family)
VKALSIIVLRAFLTIYRPEGFPGGSSRTGRFSAQVRNDFGIWKKDTVISAAPNQSDPLSGPPKPPLATGFKRVLFVVAGLAAVGMAYLGAILPGLPTTPWVLLAGYCFSRSSPRLERWLKRSPIFGKLLRDWDEHRGIRRPVKIFAVCMVVTVVTLSITLSNLPVRVKWVIGGLALVGICTIVFVVPTIREQRAEGRRQKSEEDRKSGTGTTNA